MSNFVDELESLINRYSMESGSGTPDFILAEYLDGCLKSFGQAVLARDRWYGFSGYSGNSPSEVPIPEPVEVEGKVG